MPKEIPKEEIVKWLNKIKEILPRIEANDTKGEEMYTNMKAYISDCEHFLNQEDYMRSFESIVWAWAIFEICQELGVLSYEG